MQQLKPNNGNQQRIQNGNEWRNGKRLTRRRLPATMATGYGIAYTPRASLFLLFFYFCIASAVHCPLFFCSAGHAPRKGRVVCSEKNVAQLLRQLNKRLYSNWGLVDEVFLKTIACTCLRYLTESSD